MLVKDDASFLEFSFHDKDWLAAFKAMEGHN